MRRTEGVLDEQIVAVGERLGEGGIVARFTAIEARVFEHCEGAREQLAQADLDRFHREARVLACRPSEVRTDRDRGCAAALEKLERRERGADARVVGDAPVLERNVEVGPHEDTLASDVGVTDRPHLPRPVRRRFGNGGAVHHPVQLVSLTSS